MDVVADTNVFLAVALNEPERARIIDLTAGASVLAPEILPYEIGNALSAMVKRRKLSRSEAMAAEASVRRIPVRLVNVDIRASLGIAIERGIYAYDAYFLQCARVFGHPLLTLDARMKKVAVELGVNLLELSR
jgi:predicted nucleic acid-binding protein